MFEGGKCPSANIPLQSISVHVAWCGAFVIDVMVVHVHVCTHPLHLDLLNQLEPADLSKLANSYTVQAC